MLTLILMLACFIAGAVLHNKILNVVNKVLVFLHIKAAPAAAVVPPADNTKQ